MEKEIKGVAPWVLWVLILSILGVFLMGTSLLFPPVPDELSGPALMFTAGLMSLSLAIAVTVLIFIGKRQPEVVVRKYSRWERYTWEMNASLGKCVEIPFASHPSLPEGWIPVGPCYRLARMNLRGGVTGAVVLAFMLFIGDLIIILLAVPTIAVLVAFAILNWPRYQKLRPYPKGVCKRFPITYADAVAIVDTFHDSEDATVDLSSSMVNNMKSFPHHYFARIYKGDRSWGLQMRSQVDSTETLALVWPYKDDLEGYVKRLDEALA